MAAALPRALFQINMAPAKCVRCPVYRWIWEPFCVLWLPWTTSVRQSFSCGHVALSLRQGGEEFRDCFTVIFRRQSATFRYDREGRDHFVRVSVYPPPPFHELGGWCQEKLGGVFRPDATYWHRIGQNTVCNSVANRLPRWILYTRNFIRLNIVFSYSNELTRLCAREDYIESCRRESYKTYIHQVSSKRY
jgi:hypothetical protein